ncbi:hypothetical protein V1506DRAFT_537337 [Lipomyces tetrasporus]
MARTLLFLLQPSSELLCFCFSGCVTTFPESYHSVAGSLRWWIRGKVSVMVAGKSIEGTGIGNDWVIWYIYLRDSTCRICASI